MSSSRTPRRTALALLAPLVTAGVVATAAPASAMPTEGMSAPTGCTRVVELDGAHIPGSPLFISFGYALLLDC